MSLASCSVKHCTCLFASTRRLISLFNALSSFAQRTEGLPGAALEVVVNEAAINAARRHMHRTQAQKLDAILEETAPVEPLSEQVSAADFNLAIQRYALTGDA